MIAKNGPKDHNSSTESQTMAVIKVMLTNAKCKMPKSMIANSRKKRDIKKIIQNASKRPVRPTKNEELSSRGPMNIGMCHNLLHFLLSTFRTAFRELLLLILS